MFLQYSLEGQNQSSQKNKHKKTVLHTLINLNFSSGNNEENIGERKRETENSFIIIRRQKTDKKKTSSASKRELYNLRRRVVAREKAWSVSPAGSGMDSVGPHPSSGELEVLKAELRALTVVDDDAVDLRPSQIEACARAANFVTTADLQRNRIVFAEGDRGDAAYFLTAGEVILSRRGKSSLARSSSLLPRPAHRERRNEDSNANDEDSDAGREHSDGAERKSNSEGVGMCNGARRSNHICMDNNLKHQDAGSRGNQNFRIYQQTNSRTQPGIFLDEMQDDYLSNNRNITTPNIETLTFKHKGQFGTHALVCSCPRSWTLEIASPETRLWKLSREAFETARSVPYTCSELMASHPVMGLLTGEERTALEAASQCIHASRGQVLCRHGETAHNLFLVREGEVWGVLRDGGVSSLMQLKQHGEVLWSRSQGEYFGEDAFCVRGQKYCSSDVVVAKDNTVVYAIPYERLSPLEGLRESVRHHFFVQVLLTLHPFATLPIDIIENTIAPAGYTVAFDSERCFPVDDFSQHLEDAPIASRFVVLQGSITFTAEEGEVNKELGNLSVGQAYPLRRLQSMSEIQVTIASQTCLLIVPDLPSRFQETLSPGSGDEIYPLTSLMNSPSSSLYKLRKRPRYVRQTPTTSDKYRDIAIPDAPMNISPIENRRTSSIDTMATCIDIITDDEHDQTDMYEHMDDDAEHSNMTGMTIDTSKVEDYTQNRAKEEENPELGSKRRRPRLQSLPIPNLESEGSGSFSPSLTGIHEAFGAWRGPMDGSPNSASSPRRESGSGLHQNSHQHSVAMLRSAMARRNSAAASLGRPASVPVVPFVSPSMSLSLHDEEVQSITPNNNVSIPRGFSKATAPLPFPHLGSPTVATPPNGKFCKTPKSQKQLAFLSTLTPVQTGMSTVQFHASPHRNGTPTSRDQCQGHRTSMSEFVHTAKPRTPGQAHSESSMKMSSPKKRATGLVLSLDSLERLQSLGAGAFGSVSLVRDRETNHVFALKQLSKRKIIARRQEQRVRAERAIMSKCGGQCPFIARFVRSFQDERSVYLLLECGLGGDLFDLIERRPAQNLTVEEMKFFSGQIALAIEFLHSNRVIFRDIKPENCILCVDGYLRLTDFGMAKELPSTQTRTYTLCGTPTFIAPEVLTLDGYSTSIDWWALGIFYFELMTGSFPFPAEMVSSLRARQADYISSYPTHGVFDKLDAMCEGDASFVDLVRALLHPEPDQRLGRKSLGSFESSVTSHPYFADVDLEALRGHRIAPPDSILRAVGRSRVLETLHHASTPHVYKPQASMSIRKPRTAPASALHMDTWETYF